MSTRGLVLVVEDDADHMAALTSMLNEEGYEVAAAADGLQAMEQLRWGLRPAVILLDMRMHVMNGWEFRRELSREPGCAATPVLILSGGPLKSEDLAGIAGWLAKPVVKTELLKSIEDCLQAQKAQRTRSS